MATTLVAPEFTTEQLATVVGEKTGSGNSCVTFRRITHLCISQLYIHDNIPTRVEIKCFSAVVSQRKKAQFCFVCQKKVSHKFCIIFKTV
jgi:hypothetical protein